MNATSVRQAALKVSIVRRNGSASMAILRASSASVGASTLVAG